MHVRRGGSAKKGFHNDRLNATFGFIWSRFEEHAYWWEAVEFGLRKFPLVMIALFAEDVIVKCVLGCLFVGCVMAANFAWAPYIKRVYDILDQVGFAPDNMSLPLDVVPTLSYMCMYMLSRW